jgi:hypothetical protein
MTQFDNLPAEVRNIVYNQLLRDCHPQQTHDALPLFTVSSQIHQESVSYFYKNNAIVITAASPTNDRATILPPIADKYLRFLSRLTVYATIAGANSERERRIAGTIASLTTIGAKFEDLYICIDSSLSRLANSRVDDSVLHANHPITLALRQLLNSKVASTIRIELHGVWFAPSIAQDLHAHYGTQLQFVAGKKHIMNPSILERSLTGFFASSHLTTLGVDDEVMATAYSSDASTAHTPASLPSSICSALGDLDMFSVTSFDLNSDTTADNEEPMDDANEDSFFAGIDIEEWEASTQAADQEEQRRHDDMELSEEEDEEEEIEDVSEEDIDAIMGNMEDTAHHIANDADVSYMTNFAPDLLLTRYNLGHSV